MNYNCLKKGIILLLCLLYLTQSYAQETVNFPSLDDLPITADLYKINDTATYIVLCHLSEGSRGEYKETALRLNDLGYNCLAIDTRTGKEILGITNETAIAAKKLNKTSDYLSSEQDILAAIDYADSLSNGENIILLGSSFSASLALKIAVINPKVKAVIAFSPGEYFGDKFNLKNALDALDKPAFVTSSKKEVPAVSTLIENIDLKNIVHYMPKEEGAHGSLSLWTMIPNNEEYWKALEGFLIQID
ncbi:alpha/beta hydrolase [Bizionia paragorgiae]|uniref:alpha/beta hydrolase n=1 Tax=Bizionia paragorgiae TaxID=283786 RepID=UPI003A8D0695